MSERSFNMFDKPRLRRTKFDLSHERRLTADMFYLYPTYVEDCIPGDHFKIGQELIVRQNPTVCPVMHDVYITTYYFFQPYRHLWHLWEKYWTRGRDGKFTADIPRHSANDGMIKTPGSLWDHLGFPTVKPGYTLSKYPIKFPARAYINIHYNYFSDLNLENFQFNNKPIDELTHEEYVNWLDLQTTEEASILNLRKKAFKKDYFTGALPFQQRGDPPGLPVNSILDWSQVLGSSTQTYFSPIGVAGSINQRIVAGTIQQDASGTGITNQTANNNLIEALNKVKISSTAFDVTDLRLAVQLQRLLEKMARIGSRYVENLRGIFDTYPRDDRLQRPEFIGSVRSPLIISEVLQTGATDSVSPQGNMAGHGLTADRSYAGSYLVKEHGLIMGLTCIMPKTMYKDGLERQWIKESIDDWYYPQYHDLSEQAIYREEIYNYNEHKGKDIFGYIPRYDEYRYRRSTVHGLFRDDNYFRMWHRCRDFTISNNAVNLNANFIYTLQSERNDMKRALAVPSQPEFLISIANKIHATRPLGYFAIPGRLDHN